MEKKTILLEIPAELIDRIDRLNTMGDRSEYISHLLKEQLKKPNENDSNSFTNSTTRIIDE